MDEIISSVAMGLGLVQLYDQVRKIEEIDPEMKNTIILLCQNNTLKHFQVSEINFIFTSDKK